MLSGLKANQLRIVELYVRLALAVGFLSAVADRFGLWGKPDSPNVAWGDFTRFVAYTARLNPWAPAAFVPALAWTATLAELVLGVLLLSRLWLRWTATASGVLLFLFALGMSLGTGIKSALDASVLAASAAAFALAGLPGSVRTSGSARNASAPTT
ncbi:MAG: DoxX protein [Gemmatimonadetes bacterium]|nr:DoxX protein [Gemmatimonadota bacterium]